MAAEQTAAEAALPALRAGPADAPPPADTPHAAVATGPAPASVAGPAPAPVDEQAFRARFYAAKRAFCSVKDTAALPAPPAEGEHAPRVLLTFRGGVVDACDFFLEVASYGGAETVDASKLWSAVGVGLGLNKTTDFYVATKELYENAPLLGARLQRVCVRATGRARTALRCLPCAALRWICASRRSATGPCV